MGGTFPLWDLSLPFLWDTIFEYEAAMKDPRLKAIWDKSYAEYGLIKAFETPVAALDAIWSTKEISTIADFKGVKIRTAGVPPTLALQLLGASPLTMATAEILEAMQRGTVDAIQTNVGWGTSFGLSDVSTHLNYWSVQSIFPCAVIVNMDSFNALPDDLQKIFLDTSMAQQEANVYAGWYEELITKTMVKSTGVKIITPDKAEIDKARQLTKPVMDKWVEMTGPIGKDILAIVADYAGGAEIMLK